MTWGEILTLIDNLNWRVSSLVPISGTDVTNPKRHLTPWSLLGILLSLIEFRDSRPASNQVSDGTVFVPDTKQNTTWLESRQSSFYINSEKICLKMLRFTVPYPPVYAPSSSAHPRTALRHEPQRNGLANAPKTTRSSTEQTQTTFKLKPRNRL